jgi:FKBP-type peptidyl-prolyl cis-trans isomerase FkpA
MRHALLIFLSVFAISTFAQTEAENNPHTALMTRSDSMNFFFGLNLGYSLESAPFQPNVALIAEGLELATQGKAPYDRQTTRTVFQELQMAMSQEQAKLADEAGAQNLKKGIAFLAETAKRDGVKTTDSGLQYEVLKMGEGPMPSDTSTVEVHYEGTLIDGTVFDSSYERGESISFPLNRVIAGWTEGVQLMPVGSTYRFFIPSELGYGARAQGRIPAYSVLIFKIELLGIE